MNPSSSLPLWTLFSLALSACSWPGHVATKATAFDVPAAGLQRLDCTSHNGRIDVVGDPDATQVTVRVEMSVRGHSAEEAAANLELLQVGREVDGSTLRLTGNWPREQLQRCSPSFTFTVTMPAGLELALLGHNGDLRAVDTVGPVTATTHNGDVTWRGRSRRLELTSHNGDVEADFVGEGEVRGEITTSNGDVQVAFPGAVDAMFTARTHNGSLTGGNRLAETSVARRELRGRLGSGTGQLTVVTHNGDVTVR